MSSKMRCAIIGCANIKSKGIEKPSEKYFFCCPRKEQRKQLWMEATGRSGSKFYVCEDHFDMRNDIEYYRINGNPSLTAEAYPHRNLTQPEMALQAKLDKMNWSCFVPSCENKRLMTDKKVVFFPVPEGLQGQLWRSAVSEDSSCVNASSLDEIQLCCEEHFDITMDLNKNFSTGTSIKYTVKAGVLPSLNLHDKKLEISNEIQPRSLTDLNSHPRVILNNDISYLYAAKFPLLIEKLERADVDTFVNVKHIKSEPIESEQMIDIKTEPMDTGYEYEINSEFLIKTEESNFDINPLDLDPKCKSERESESDSSISNKESDNDSDITTDDLSTTTDEDSYEPDSSDESIEPETDTDDADSDLDTERFECCHCNQFVKHLERHVERAHWNFSNINRTQCGLCWESFPLLKDLRRHQSNVHDGNAYACDICNCLTRTYAEIQTHIIRIHCNEQRFLCQHCGKGYKFIWEQRRHERKKHTGVVPERTHACHLCDKKFFISSSLNKHVKSVHINLRSFRCNVDGCNKAYNQKSYLQYHHRQVHLKQNHHSCVICEKTFSFKGNLTVHMKKVHKT